MPTVEEGIEKLLFWKRQGKGHCHLPHLVLVEEEAEKRVKNEPDEQDKRKTKIAWETDSPEVYAEFHEQRERYMKLCQSHKTIATTLMITALRHFTDEELREFLEENA